MPKRRVAVLISGHGSNLQALIDACRAADYPAEIVFVISNKAEAYGLIRAKTAGISTMALSHKNFPSRETFDAAMQAELLAHGVDIVCLAGFMRLLTPGFVNAWQGRMLNVHPSLLPAFKGLNAIGQALAAGVAVTGCTVHLVTPEMDAGPIVEQAEVPILPDDTLESLSARVHAEEHRIYPKALAALSLSMTRAVFP